MRADLKYFDQTLQMGCTVSTVDTRKLIDLMREVSHLRNLESVAKRYSAPMMPGMISIPKSVLADTVEMTSRKIEEIHT